MIWFNDSNNNTYRGWIYTGDGKNDNTGNGEKLSNVVKIYSADGAFGALTNNGNVFVWGFLSSGGSSVFIDSYNNIPNPLPSPIDKQ
jgi:hypothetical protein